MKTILKPFLLMVILSFSTYAKSDTLFTSGDYKFTGDAYISAVAFADQTVGIGRITTISQGSNILWSTGDNGEYLNFTFDSFAPVIAPTAPIYNFMAEGGSVDIYMTSDSTVFDTTLGVIDAMDSIQSSGGLWLASNAVGNTVGIATPFSYSANGFLDIVGGFVAPLLNSNSRPTFDPGVFADLSFGLVGSNNMNPLVNQDYQYITSVDVQATSAVPIEDSYLFMMTGIGMLIIVNRRKPKLDTEETFALA